MKEEHGLPVLPLPPCAPAIHVKQFKGKHSRSGPDASNIQYNWRSPLGKCPWNRQATLLLAMEYLELYKNGKIKLNHLILPYDPKVDLKTIQKTIRTRISRTQTYWKDENLPNNTDNDNDDTTAIPCTKEERAERKITLARHRMRGLKVTYFPFVLSLILISNFYSYLKCGKKTSKSISMETSRRRSSTCFDACTQLA